jgi:aldehyde dehydrogenase (NAD+)
MWEYSPALETPGSIGIDSRHELFIGGRWCAPRSGCYFDTESPSREEKLSEISLGGAIDVDDAVRAARFAYDKYWRPMRGRERAKILFRVASAIQEKAHELAVVESMNGGKPVRESRDVDLPLTAAHFFYHAGWADKLDYAFHGRTPRSIGVAALLVPWNVPLLAAARKLGPALACGNTVVLKPAKSTALTALRLARILEETDVPPGLVNVVTGGEETGAALAAHPGVDKVSFTGGAEAGKRLAKALAGTKKRLSVELGGKASNIVFGDAPIDQAVDGILGGTSFSRLLVEESVHDQVVSKLRRRMDSLRVGDPLDKNTDVGAIHSRARLDELRALVADGEASGAVRYASPCALPAKGYWFPPTLFTNVGPTSRLAREEIFGPVLSILTFRTPDEAIEMANHTMDGLSAGVWTDKGAKALWMAQRLRAGIVWANAARKFDPSVPFGGYKESGFGREGGRQGLHDYVELCG